MAAAKQKKHQTSPPEETAVETRNSTQPSRRRLWRIAFLSIVGICVLTIGSLTAYAFYISNRILPHTTIAGVDVGGLTQDQATQKLVTKEQAFSASKLTLTFGSKSWQFATSSLSPKFSNDAALAAAYAVGKQGSIQNQVEDFFRSLFQPRSYNATLAPLTAPAYLRLSTAVLTSIQTLPKETTLNIQPNAVTIVPGVPGHELLTNDFQSNVYQAFASGNSQVGLKLGTVGPQVSTDEATLTQKTAQAALASNWTLTANGHQLTVTPQDLASWLTVSVARDSSGETTGLALG
jgi:hypothetical protein